VAWNCGGGLHRKLDFVLGLQPDVAVLSEACRPERLRLPVGATTTWVGRLAHKGLLVVGLGDTRVRALRADASLEWVLPVAVEHQGAEISMLAVWSMNRRASNWVAGSRVQPHAAIEVFGLADERPHLVIGDFNSHPRWDKPRRPTFAPMVADYSKLGLHSFYHRQTGETHGGESTPTHWWRDRRADGQTYHIDYAFVRDDLIDRATLRIGSFEESVVNGRSDHAPLIVDIAVAAAP
jgi:hypothetical protein